MIFKVYWEPKITPSVNEKERVIPNSKDKVRNRFYKAYAVVNFFDLMLEELVGCGKTHTIHRVLFFDTLPGQCIDELYPAFCAEQRKEEINNRNKFQYSESLTMNLKLQLNFTFMTVSQPQRL